MGYQGQRKMLMIEEVDRLLERVQLELVQRQKFFDDECRCI